MSRTFKQTIKGSNINTFMSENKQNKMSISKTINEREEKEENEDSKVPSSNNIRCFVPYNYFVVSNFNMASKGPRRYSKTTVKPFVSMMSNIKF